MFRNRFIPLILVLLGLLGLVAERAQAQLRPSSALLLPYFEVDLKGSGKTTLFALGNALDQPVDVDIEIRTNWGIVVSNIQERLEARQVRSFNLRDWVLQGRLPDRTLRTADRDQLKSALAGQRAPLDNLFYGTSVAANLAVGSVVIRTAPFQPANALWGDFLLVDGSSSVSMGDNLVNIDQALSCPGASLCSNHALRFISGKEISAETEMVIWTDRAVDPSRDPYPENRKLALDGKAFDEDGQVISDVHLRLMPLQVVTVGSLGLRDPFGWIQVESKEPTFIGVHFGTSKKDGAALQAFCLPSTIPPPPDTPGLEIEKRTNGEDADLAPGPTVAVGAPITWEYIVRNTGKIRLTHVEVTDDDSSIQVSCPKEVMDPGDVMVCTAHGTAGACQYQNVGTVTASQPDGPELSAEDASHYFGSENPKIDVELSINGQDADEAPGPTFQPGTPLQWTYVVTNTGDVNLTDVKVTDDRNGAVSCPKTSLHPGESMTCTATGSAAPGQFRNVGTATAAPPCGKPVTDSDPAQYQVDGEPGLKIQKLTNGQHNTQAPGASIGVGSPITWSYIVTNTGKLTLNNVKVTDDKIGAIACPKTTLKAGESMTCTASGTAAACQYQNTGTVVGTALNNASLSAQDWGYYFGQTHPSITLKKFTNGQDADTAPGPSIPAGSPVTWTYVAKNTGDVALTGVAVTDNRGVAVICPKTSLQPGETMTCTGSGTATPGQYENIGSVTAQPPCGPYVQASDPSHYLGTGDPGIKIQKLTNGQHFSQAPGANLNVGSPVTWSYLVTNTGQVALGNVKVTDDKVGNIACPKTTLQPGESMTCTASGTAAACQYSNKGTVTAMPPSGPNVVGQDWSFYFGQIHPTIDIQKLTNGQDGPTINVGDPVKWTYQVANTGDVALTGVKVTDDKGVAVSCPKTSLQKGESMTCTGNGTAISGQYHNVGTVTASAPCDQSVKDSDESWYTGKSQEYSAKISIKKYTNGEDADFAPGPKIAVGGAVTWTYIVKNTGEVALSSVKVTDNKGVAVTCPKTTLQVGEQMTCTGSGKATAGQYENIGSAVGTPPSGSNVTDSDPSHYFGDYVKNAQIVIKKYTNGEDADFAPGPHINVGGTVTWTYIVKNVGEVALSSVKVTDNKGVAVTCPKTTLQVGEQMTCTGSGKATAGQYENIGSAVGTPPSGSNVTDDDPSHYYGDGGYVPPGKQGCTPGYWKNHTSSWKVYSPSQKLRFVFDEVSEYDNLEWDSLLEGLGYNGGSGNEGAARILLRAAVASLLNSAHSGVSFPRSTASVISDVNAALNSDNRDKMLALATALDNDNNGGCPLN